MLIETHAHLDYPDFANDFDDVLRRAIDVGVTRRARELPEAHVRERPDQRDRDNTRAEIEADLLVECERHFTQPALDKNSGCDKRSE